MHSETCEHRVETHPHTTADGRVQTIPYCFRCGMEWEPKEQVQAA